MKLFKLLDKLQDHEVAKVVLVHVGACYIVLGEDAYILNLAVGLKVTEYSDYMYKVGISIFSFKKCIDKLEELNISFVIYG